MSLKEAIKKQLLESIDNYEDDLDDVASAIEEVVLEYLENEELQELDNEEEDLLDDDSSFNGVF
jgi:hypothetical protein